MEAMEFAKDLIKFPMETQYLKNYSYMWEAYLVHFILDI